MSITLAEVRKNDNAASANAKQIISIIVPVYDMEKYLARCLESLVHQEYEKIEIICVNDGSRDGSLGILEQFAEKDKRIRVITQRNMGLAGARNTGLAHARGEYIMFCDSDDWYEPTMCAQMVRTIEREGVDLVSCRNDFVFDEACGADQKKRATTSKFFTIGFFGRCRMSSVLRFGLNCIVCTKIFRHSIIKEHAIRFPEGCEHEDNAFWYIYSFFVSDVFIIEDKLYHYFIRKNSIMDNCANLVPRNKFDKIRIVLFLMAFLKGKKFAARFRSDIAYLAVRDSAVYASLFTEEESRSVCAQINEAFCELFDTKLKLLKHHGTAARTFITCRTGALLRFLLPFVLIKYGRVALYLAEAWSCRRKRCEG